MVVLVFITNCQVSLKVNISPVTAQTKMISTARTKVARCPAAPEVHLANRVNGES